MNLMISAMRSSLRSVMRSRLEVIEIRDSLFYVCLIRCLVFKV